MELISTLDNPVPQGAVCSQVTTSDGFKLRAMAVRVGKPRGTVIVLGGRADFMERYFETMRDMIARGFCVASLDLRGQGGSQRLINNPLRGHINRFEQYDEDVRSFMTQVVLPDCPPPYYAIAHSTGGNVILRALRNRNWFKKCVLVSPLLGFRYGAWPVPVVRVLTTLATALGLGWAYLPGQRHTPLGRKDFIGNPLTSDQCRWNRDSAVLESAPSLAVGGPTYGWLRAAIKSIDLLRKLRSAKDLRCPVLIVAAGRDDVVDIEATYRFSRNVTGVSMVVVHEALHEIMLERDEVRAQFLAAFDAFVTESA
jgi:lysophospholipase